MIKRREFENDKWDFQSFWTKICKLTACLAFRLAWRLCFRSFAAVWRSSFVMSAHRLRAGVDVTVSETLPSWTSRKLFVSRILKRNKWLVEYAGGIKNWKMDKERVEIGLDRLNLVSKCATQRADHFDAKFTITDPIPNPTLYIFIFQFDFSPSFFFAKYCNHSIWSFPIKR